MIGQFSRFEIKRLDEENIEVALDGQYISSANHDSDGWAGMETLEKTIRRIGEVLCIPVIEI